MRAAPCFRRGCAAARAHAESARRRCRSGWRRAAYHGHGACARHTKGVGESESVARSDERHRIERSLCLSSARGAACLGRCRRCAARKSQWRRDRSRPSARREWRAFDNHGHVPTAAHENAICPMHHVHWSRPGNRRDFGARLATMPVAHANGGHLHYQIEGPGNAPALVLSNSLGTNFAMWDAQMPELRKHFRVLRYDTRGHGQSEVTPGPYSFEQLGRDVLALADETDIGSFSFCGLSMGGVTGMWLGIHAAKRLHKLVLCSTGAKIGNAEIWDARIETVRKGGTKSIAAGTMERWFTARFRESSPEIVERVKHMVESTSTEGYIACCAALREVDLRESIAAITSPTLVISGTHDPATPPADGQFIAHRIPGARYFELDAAHLSNIEQQNGFTAELSAFLRS